MADRYVRFYQQLACGPAATQKNGVLLVINNFSTGGAQSSARRLLKEFQRQGINVRAAVLQEKPDHPTPGRRELIAVGIPVLSLPPAGSMDPLRALESLIQEIQRRPPMSVLLWNVIPEYKLLLADLLFDTDLFDVSPGEMNFQSLDSYFTRPRPGLPCRSPADYGRRLKGAVVKYSAERQRAEETLQTCVHVIPNGVPLCESVVIHQARPVVVLGTAARINPQKRLEDLIHAVRLADPLMPPYELRIAGGVEPGCQQYAEQLRQQALGLPIVWLGDVPNPQDFLLLLDLFVMVSHPAGCPNASLEAMAAGLPVIATDFGGASEQVIDGVTGRLVPAQDPQAMAHAMAELASDADLRRIMGAAARQRITEVFSIEQMAKSYRQVVLGDTSAFSTLDA